MLDDYGPAMIDIDSSEMADENYAFVEIEQQHLKVNAFYYLFKINYCLETQNYGSLAVSSFV